MPKITVKTQWADRFRTVHTPGPWTVTPGYDESAVARVPATVSNAARTCAVAAVYNCDGRNADANARLIAAAPALLAALQEVLSYLDACVAEQRFDASPDDADSLAEGVRAALVQATGEDEPQDAIRTSTLRAATKKV